MQPGSNQSGCKTQKNAVQIVSKSLTFVYKIYIRITHIAVALGFKIAVLGNAVTLRHRFIKSSRELKTSCLAGMPCPPASVYFLFLFYFTFYPFWSCDITPSGYNNEAFWEKVKTLWCIKLSHKRIFSSKIMTKNNIKFLFVLICFCFGVQTFVPEPFAIISSGFFSISEGCRLVDIAHLPHLGTGVRAIWGVCLWCVNMLKLSQHQSDGNMRILNNLTRIIPHPVSGTADYTHSNLINGGWGGCWRALECHCSVQGSIMWKMTLG